MKASFIIVFHTQRIDNLLQTLRFLTKRSRDTVRQSELVTVCQDNTSNLPTGNYEQFRGLTSHFENHNHFDADLPFMQFARMNNVAVSLTTTDKFVFLESDRILPEGYFETVIEQLAPKTAITCKNMRKLLSPRTDEQIESGIYDWKADPRSETNMIGARNIWSGNTAITRRDFFDAGMMDEEYTGYGWTDNDMTKRIEQIGVQQVFRDEIELHLWHPPATYGAGDQKQMFINGGIRYCKTWGLDMPDWFRKEIAEHKKIML